MDLIEEQIYEAAFCPELWPKIMDRMSRAIGGEGAILANLASGSLPWIASDGVADLYLDFFKDGWAFDNARTHSLINTPHHGFMSDADLMTEEWMAQQTIYRDFLWPRGFGYAAGTLIEGPGNIVLGFSIDKLRSSGPATHDDLLFLDRLRPHLARAAVLSSKLEFAKVEAALQALTIANIPAATIRRDGRLLATNNLFEDFSATISTGARDVLRFKNASANKFYQELSESGSPRHRQGYSFPLQATDRSPPAILHFLPVTGTAREIFLEAGHFLLITPADSQQTLSAPVIKGLFDLTPAEARIAEKLAQAYGAPKIAAIAGLSVETVRSHIKAIFAKAGVKGQREFLALVTSIRPIGSANNG